MNALRVPEWNLEELGSKGKREGERSKNLPIALWFLL